MNERQQALYHLINIIRPIVSLDATNEIEQQPAIQPHINLKSTQQSINSIPQFLPLDFVKMPTSRGLSAGSRDGVRFLDPAHKARYVEISESQAIKTAESSIKLKLNSSKLPAFTKELCFGVCRHYIRLSMIADTFLKKRPKDIEIWICLLLGLYELHFCHTPDYAAVKETVALLHKCKLQWAKGLVNAILRRYCQERTQLISKLQHNDAFLYGHPSWLMQRIQQAWPDNWQEILQANDEHPPMVLRVNCRYNTPAEYINYLQQTGITAISHPYVQDAIILKTPMDVQLIPGFYQGLCSVQDGSAQLAVNLLQLQPKLRVLDACCAPGGKLGHILEKEPHATVIGLDIDQRRLNKVHNNLQRIQQNTTLILGDAKYPTEWWDGIKFDRILLDAPCSAIGVIRRHPDIKLLRTERDIIAVVQLQHQILNSLWPLLADQGLLLYITCSILPEENELQIAKFIQQHQDCTAMPIQYPYAHTTQHGLQILPGHSNMDGFFYSVLQKNNKFAS